MGNLFRMITFFDILDIVIVSYLFYQFFLLVQGTRSVQLLVGVGILIIATFVSHFIKLETIYWMLTKFWTIGVVALLIVFQPEIRQALVKMGQRPFLRPFLLEEKFIEKVVQSVLLLAKAKFGAIIVFERNMGLQDYVKTGVAIDSEYTTELVSTIFSPNTLLHDGAVIVKNKRIVAAGCLLPLTDKTGLDRIYGMRHRAGMGLGEESDALVIVVSEESGNISMIVNGKITPNLNEELLREMLIMHGS